MQETVRNFAMALRLAIKRLHQYTNADEDAGLNGAGCYSKPQEVVEKWIKEINKISIGQRD